MRWGPRRSGGTYTQRRERRASRPLRYLYHEKPQAGPVNAGAPRLWALLAPRLRVPVLLVHDREDPDVPYGHAEQIMRAWPEARLVTTGGTGSPGDPAGPAVVRETVEFLRKGVTG